MSSVFIQKKTAPKGGCERCLQWIELMIYQFDIHGIETLAALFELEAYPVIFVNLVDKPGSVHEILGAAVLLPDETKTFGLVEELYNSFIHVNKNLRSKDKPIHDNSNVFLNSTLNLKFFT
jgi:hypothetical protein